jgi:predicted nucleic acid-binding protein
MSDGILVDTNVLLRSIQIGHPQQVEASESIVILRSQGHLLTIAPQNLYEFWVVCTRPVIANGLGRTAQQTAAELATLQSFLSMLDDGPLVFSAWQSLVTKENVLGKQAHDARLVAIMQVHGASQLLTFNAADFRRYRSIQVLSPDDLRKQSS